MTTINARMKPPAPESVSFRDIESELPAALAGGRMHLYFQPVVSLADRSATLLEALPRWDHEEHGVIGPQSFIGPARAAGLLERIERWAITDAMHQLAHWSSGIPAQLSISVNLSTPHAISPELAVAVRETAAATAVTTSRLGIEIPETALAEMDSGEMPSLRALADIGVNLTLDGYSGRLDNDRLQLLPISSLKVARDVVAGIPDDPQRSALVDHILALGRDMGIAVIATGIENPGQAAALRDAGCRYGQGFLFSVPMPAEVLEERILGR